MAKLKCVSLESGAVDSNRYTTPKGNQHLFQKGTWTDVNDPDDVAHFLKAGNGKLFIDKDAQPKTEPPKAEQPKAETKPTPAPKSKSTHTKKK